MTVNPWADLEPTNGDYYELKKTGDSFEATVKSKDIDEVDFGDGKGIKRLPRLFFEDGKHFTFTNAVGANAVIKLDPQPGQRIRVARGDKIPGSRAVMVTVDLVDNSSDRPAPAAVASKPKNDAPPF